MWTKVVGVTHENDDGTNRQDILESLSSEDDIELELEREPDNPYDENAIAVMTSDGEQIGYLNKSLAEELSEQMDNGGKVTIKGVEIYGGEDGKSYGCKVDVAINGIKFFDDRSYDKSESRQKDAPISIKLTTPEPTLTPETTQQPVTTQKQTTSTHTGSHVSYYGKEPPKAEKPLLIRCPVCKKQISSTVKTCPHCGYVLTTSDTKKAVKNAKVSAVIILVLIILVSFFVIHSCNGCSGKKEQAKSQEQSVAITQAQQLNNIKIAAITMAQEYIKKLLKAPASAKFPWDMKEYQIGIKDSGKTFIVNGYVDSQNSYGAMLRVKWHVEESTPDNGQHWRLINATLLE